ncbi:unnamed protein product [Soboliphyme baturini]|uniref:Uncharacterized protein n=1 Tax=Soboliphyme baturini TaxID=241478 RepID=A0A183J814_9BILA|nr:unnamed protein product [Soboliphyme baturini]
MPDYREGVKEHTVAESLKFGRFAASIDATIQFKLAAMTDQIHLSFATVAVALLRVQTVKVDEDQRAALLPGQCFPKLLENQRKFCSCVRNQHFNKVISQCQTRSSDVNLILRTPPMCDLMSEAEKRPVIKHMQISRILNLEILDEIEERNEF